MFSKQTSFLKSVNKSPPLSSKFRINASGHLIPLLTKKWLFHKAKSIVDFSSNGAER